MATFQTTASTSIRAYDFEQLLSKLNNEGYVEVWRYDHKQFCFTDKQGRQHSKYLGVLTPDNVVWC